MRSGLRRRTTINIGVTVEDKVVVGRRLHHQAGVHRRRPQGQSSPPALSGLSRVAVGSVGPAPWARGPGMAGGRWCRIRAPSSGRRRRSGPSDQRDLFGNANVRDKVYSRNEPNATSQYAITSPSIPIRNYGHSFRTSKAAWRRSAPLRGSARRSRRAVQCRALRPAVQAGAEKGEYSLLLSYSYTRST